jgi:hypothetical protein
MTNNDVEVVAILEDLPTIGQDAYSWLRTAPTNARVAMSRDGRYLEIWPVGGGWLGVKVPLLEGDLAPFAD